MNVIAVPLAPTALPPTPAVLQFERSAKAAAEAKPPIHVYTVCVVVVLPVAGFVVK